MMPATMAQSAGARRATSSSWRPTGGAAPLLLLLLQQLVVVALVSQRAAGKEVDAAAVKDGVSGVVVVDDAAPAKAALQRLAAGSQQQQAAVAAAQAASDNEEAAINALRNLLIEEDRLLKYLGGSAQDSVEYDLPNLQFQPQKRSCLRRGASCDARPNDCCESSACRCNLWGTNCRCHRAGLLRRLG